MIKVDNKLRRKVDHLLRRAEAALLPEVLLVAEAKHTEPAAAREALRGIDEKEPSLGIAARTDALAEAEGSYAARRDYLARYGCCGVRRFSARGDVAIYLMPVETFPHHINNVYLVLEPGHAMLVDVGSGKDSSRRDLALGFAIVRAMFGEAVRYETIDTAVVSHAHIDHFGGVNDLKVKTAARLCVHELDARVIAGFEERVVIAAKDVSVFLRRAGVGEEERARMLELYMASRDWFRSVEVDRTLRDGDLIGGGHRVIHTPGHCPGQICLLVGDVLLTSDHVLSRTTPHQFPQAITPFGGLEHYFHSLAKVRKLDLVNLALAGHEEPIADLRHRVDEIAAFHRERLMKVRDICDRPRTVAEVAAEMFGPQEGYGTLLAIEEAGAHVEYLHTLGKLRIANLDQVARSEDPVLQYVRR
jgi:glyoxylase-like metal-dependent hydrolase (beta-lactamase superfamily II)